MIYRLYFEAFKQSAQNNNYVQIIFMDMQMPGWSGIETSKKISQYSSSAKLPVRPKLIGLSGNSKDDLDIDDENRKLFDAFLQKPVNKKMLAAVIQQVYAAKSPPFFTLPRLLEGSESRFSQNMLFNL